MSQRKPQTMDEMLSLTREEALEIDDFEYRGDPSIKAVTRHMVKLLADELTWQGRENSQSLRGLWYAGVKQVYQNLFPERWGTDYYSESASRRFSQSLSEHTSEMVKEGVLTYRDLNIVDDSRKREVLGTDSVEYDKILFVEKEAKYRQLLPIADVLGVSIVSGGGWQATALIEDLANVLEDDESYSIFVLTDYDPTGYQIADDFRDRARTLGITVERVERVGIEPDQVPEETLQAEKFRVPVENDTDRAWLQRHGIENDVGDPLFGLELEAIGSRGSQAEDFRRVAVEALEPHLRRDRHRGKMLNKETANTAGSAANRVVEDVTNDLEEAVRELAAGLMEERDPVNTCTTKDHGLMAASVDLEAADSPGDEMVPYPLPWDRYKTAAIEGEDMKPRPNSRLEVVQLKNKLVEEIDSGALDLDELINLDG